MYNGPRVPRDRRQTEAVVEKAVIGTGCFFALIWLVFWTTVIYVVAHFVLKFW